MHIATLRALVTGASSGIGRAVAQQLAAGGARLALQGRNVPRLEALQDTLATNAHTPLLLPADLTVEAAATGAVQAAAEGLDGLDCVIHCAGISQRDNPAFAAICTEEYRRIMQTNADATLYIMRAALPCLAAAPQGYLINILSTAATSVGAGGGVYAASKHAARALQEALAAECRGSGVRVSSVSPGPVDTEIWSHKAAPPPAERKARMLRPEDVAGIVLFLLRQDANVFIPDVRVEPWLYRK